MMNLSHYGIDVLDKNTYAIVIPNSKETLMLAEESRSKMLLKQHDPMVLEKKNSMNSSDPSPSKRLTKVEVLKELPKVSMEQAVILREVVEQGKSKNHLNNSLDHACKYTKRIQEFLILIRQTWPRINNSSDKLVAITPKNKDKRVRFTKPVTSSGNINKKIASSSNLVSNKPTLSSIGVKPSTSASRSQPSGNTKKDKIQQPPSRTSNVQHSKINANSELICVQCNGCMLYDNHDMCVLNVINDVNARHKTKSSKKTSKRKVWKSTSKVFNKIGYTWRPTGQTFPIIGNVFLLTKITTTTKVPFRKPTALETDTPKPVATLVYSRKLRRSKTSVPVSKPKISKSISANNTKPSKSWGSIVSYVPSSSFDECKLTKLFFGKIMGYGDYYIGNIMISRVCYMEGLGHNLFSIRQFYESNLEVAFRQHTCFIRNLEGDDLLTGSQGNNLYTLSLGDMIASSPICLLSKASKTKSWLWHRCLSHLNFSTVHHLARHGLVQEAVATACYTQNRSIIRLHHGKTPYELLHEKLPDLSFFHVFGALSYPINDNENFGKLQLKADIEPTLHEMTHTTTSLGFITNPPPSTPYIPPSRNDWDLFFQPLFDKLLTPPPSVDPLAPEVITLITEVVAPEPIATTGSPSSTTIDQDAPSTSNSHILPETQFPNISNDVEEENHDLNVTNMNNDPFVGISILKNDSKSSSSDVIPTVVHTVAPNSEHVSK
nr:hypothetical protein [Tanacetum cinerariifolium]